MCKWLLYLEDRVHVHTLSHTHTTLRHSWKCTEKIPRFSHLHFRSGVIYDLWPFWSSFHGRGGASPQISLGPKPCFTSQSLSLWGLLPGTPGPWERAPGGRRGRVLGCQPLDGKVHVNYPALVRQVTITLQNPFSYTAELPAAHRPTESEIP